MTSRPLELALEASFEQLCRRGAGRPSASRSPARTEPLRWAGGRSGVAWSTIKVPLAIAALRSDWLRARDLAVKTITESDNAASEELWSRLGDPADAARQVQAVIAEGGDTATVVESRRLRPGFTAFGQTQWTLQRQARFAAELPHSRRGRRHRPDAQPHHRPALGTGRQRHCRKGRLGSGNGRRLPGPAIRDRAHTVRAVGVALAAEAHDGVFETGVDVVNALADWLVSRPARASPLLTARPRRSGAVRVRRRPRAGRRRIPRRW